MSKQKRRNKPKWGTTDPRPVNRRRPQLDPDTGLPPVGQGKPVDRDELLRQARQKHTRRPR